MERFGLRGNFPERVVHHQRWSSLTGRSGQWLVNKSLDVFASRQGTYFLSPLGIETVHLFNAIVLSGHTLSHAKLNFYFFAPYPFLSAKQ